MLPLLLRKPGSNHYTLDFSSLPDGNLPSRMLGPTWQVVSNKAVNSPVLGAELLTDGGLEDWASATNLTSWLEAIAGTSTVNKESAAPHGGSFASRHDIDSSSSAAQIYQALTAAVANWLHVQFYIKGSTSSTKGGLQSSGANIADFSNPMGTEYILLAAAGLITTANPQLYLKQGGATPSTSIYFDDVSAKLLTTTSLYSVIRFGQANVRVYAGCIIFPVSLAGVISKLDNPSNPQNYVVLTHDGRKTLKLWKVAAGVPSLVTSVDPANYVAGALVELRWTASDTCQMFYNGTQRGTDQTINNATIIANKYHGLFSTFGGNTLDTFFVGQVP